MIEVYCFAAEMHLCAMIMFIELVRRFKNVYLPICVSNGSVSKECLFVITRICRFHVAHRTLHPLRLSLQTILAQLFLWQSTIRLINTHSILMSFCVCHWDSVMQSIAYTS